MSDHDHSAPIPAEGESDADTCKLGMTKDHTHEHTGWTKWRPLLAFALLTLGLILAVVRVEQVGRRHDAQIRQQTAAYDAQIRRQTEAYVVQIEENCRARDQQQRATAASNAVGRRFFLKMAKVMRTDGDLRTAKYIEDGLKAIPPPKAPSPTPNCNLTPEVIP